MQRAATGLSLLGGPLTALFLVASAERVLAARCDPAGADAASIAAARAAVDAACDCNQPGQSHGQYASCAANVLKGLPGGLRKECKGTVKRCYAKSTCGKPGSVACCFPTKCKVQPDAGTCTRKGGQVGSCPSCCDACTGTGCSGSRQEVTCTLGATNTEDGLSQVEIGGDGMTSATTHGGRECRRLVFNGTGGRYMYFNVRDDFILATGTSVVVSAEYNAQGIGQFRVDYDSTDPAAPVAGAYKATGGVSVDGSGTWRTATLALPDAYFGNRENGGTDFRIARDDSDAFDLCIASVTVGRARCGDGIVTPGEECDDGNAVEGDGCDSNCTHTGCGNGIVTAGETCDDGNDVPGDTCDPNCTPPGCGNGALSGGEQCDDGNQADGDGCEADCTLTACSTATGPPCDGFCAGPDSMCAEPTPGAGCQCLMASAPCGAAAGAPECLGECPPFQACRDAEGTCACTPVDATTLHAKMLAGYNGWFACPGDGSFINTWQHWALGEPAPDTATVDFWPETSELDADELCATQFTRPGGSPAPLYSGHNRKTVVRHFKWMLDSGIDGVVLQRFAFSSVPGDPATFEHPNQVLRNVRAGAEAYGRVFMVRYDVSAHNQATLVDDLEGDWRYLVDSLRITESPRYLRHGGRPVLGIWGLGFIDRPGTPAQAAQLISYFKSDADERYRATLVGGVPTYWRTLTNDSQSNPAWADVYRSFDIIEPWAVGRYNNEAGADAYKRDIIVPDMAEATANGAEYMTVVFPGFSWRNLWLNRDGLSYPLNQIPRNGGNFLWRQLYNAISAGNTMIFIAMFDEVDEGTAIYKTAPTPAEMPAQGSFVPLNIDGYSLPSDWYLRLAGEGGKMLRGEIPLSSTIPIRP